jgi:predicted phosphodiesterase
MSRLLVFTDSHLREKEPFFRATRRALTEILSLVSEGDTLLCLGDFFDKSTLTGKLAATAAWFWGEAKRITGNRGVCLTGNHDVSSRYGNALSMFQEQKENGDAVLLVITEPQTMVLSSGMKIGLLPHLHGSRMKEEYPGVLQAWEQEKGFTAVFGHFSADPLFGDEVDISELKHAPIYLGHIHVVGEEKGGVRYIGPVTPTRYDERNIQPRVIALSSSEPVTVHPLGNLLEYREIRYGDQTSEDSSEYGIYTILDAPSVRAVREMYPNLVIREIRVTGLGTEESSSEVSLEQASLKEMFSEFKKTLTSPTVAEKLQKVLGNRA